MDGKTDKTLRYRLRRDTREAHERLDHVAGGLDLQDRGHYTTFVLGQATAYAELKAMGVSANGLVERRLDLAKQDLDLLGQPFEGAGGLNATDAVGINDLGALYVIAGSHLGAQQLRKVVACSAEPEVRAALHMLDDKELGQDWRQTVRQLGSMPAQGQEADDIIRSAIICFSVFEGAFEAARDKAVAAA